MRTTPQDDSLARIPYKMLAFLIKNGQSSRISRDSVDQFAATFPKKASIGLSTNASPEHTAVGILSLTKISHW